MATINREFMEMCAASRHGAGYAVWRCGRCGCSVRGEIFCWEDVWVCGECFRDLLGEQPLCDLADVLDVPRREV